MFEFAETRIMQAKARAALNDHVYITSYLVCLVALKKLKMAICIYSAGMESERASSDFMSSSTPSFVIDLDATTSSKAIAATVVIPRKNASLNEIIKSLSISSLFKSVDPAIFISDDEKNPIATTVRKEIAAHASEA